MQNLDVREASPASPGDQECGLEGQLIAGKYRVERRIGGGGMGVVVSALHVDLERPVAIKLIREELTRDASALQRFLLEARAVAKMTSEHICRVLDVDKLDNGTPFIVMELLQGRDLAALLRERGRLEASEAVDWVLQACEGVAEAHSLRIVHRDLKPENLFLTRLSDGSACVKVLDFGVSKSGGAQLQPLTAPRTMVGSPRYMAPEQMLFASADERADVWAIGTILYELSCGVPAFAGDSVPSICSHVINEAPVPPRVRVPDLPLELQRVILRCLAREPHARYASLAALAQDLAPLGSPAARESARRIAVTLGEVPGVLPPTQRSAPINESGARLAFTLEAQPRRAWLWAALPLALVLALVAASWLRGFAGFSEPRSASPGSVPAALTPAAPAAPNAVAAPARPPSTAVSALEAARVPSAPSSPGAAVSSAAVSNAAGPHAAPRNALRTPTPSASVPVRFIAPSAAAPAAARSSSKSSATTPTAAETPRRNTARAQGGAPGAHLQEAWDVNKFGGRE